MDSSDFTILIGRLEREAHELPRLHTFKVAFLAALGYLWPALLALWVLGTLLLFLHSVLFGEKASASALLGCLAGAAALAAAIRSLWARIPEPEGVQISPQHAPELFAVISAAEKLNTASVHTVRINAEFAVSLRQIPRWSIFGGYSNHLQIGLALLAALSVDELVALLAHEMSHLKRRDHGFSAWIYRQRPVWSALLQRFQQPANAFDRLLARFYRWYIPYFQAYTFAMARNDEYAADRAAAEITDPQVLGDALIKTELAGRFLTEVFWPSLFAQVEKTAETPRRPYKLMQRALHSGHKAWTRREWLSQALRKYGTEGDTHPSLADRLAAIRAKPTAPAYDADSSALSLLGPSAEKLVAHCDKNWHSTHATKWVQRHRDIKSAHWKISQYERSDPASLSPEDLWAKANLHLSVNQEADAIQTLELLAARREPHGKARMLLAQLLLAQGDERGLQHLIAAARQDATLASSAAGVGYDYLVTRGRKHEATRFWRQIEPTADH